MCISKIVQIPHKNENFLGELTVFDAYSPVIVFAHTPSNSRLNARTRSLSQILNKAGLSTLLLNLLSSAEQREDATTECFRFNVELMAERLKSALYFLHKEIPDCKKQIGILGCTTGAAAALMVAASEQDLVRSVVCREGRIDLARVVLPKVNAPTLLIVGGSDVPILDVNKGLFECLVTTKELIVVPGASHLFEEPNALETVGRLAATWFLRYLTLPQSNYRNRTAS